MANQGPIAQEQLDELRTLNMLKANGEISAEEYRRQKASIMNRSLVLEATTRTVGGISEKALSTASSGGLPRIAKQLIALAVLMIAGYIGWAVYQSQSAGDGAEEVATEQDAAPAAMDLASLTQDPPATPTPATTEPKAAPAAGEAMDDVTVSATPSLNQFNMQEVEPLNLEEEGGEPKPLAWLQAAPEPAPQPVAPPQPEQPAADPAMAAHQPPQQPDAAQAPHPWDQRYRRQQLMEQRRQHMAAIEAAKPKIIWSVLQPDIDRFDRHPFVKLCDVAKKIQEERYQAVIGVTVGPKATGFEDLAYIAYRDQMRQQFINEVDQAAPGQFSFSALPKPVTVGDAEAERFTAKGRATSNVGILFTTVQDGQVYAYWFEGHQTLYRTFSETVGKAKLIEEASPAQ